jgi:hypothetical protein
MKGQFPKLRKWFLNNFSSEELKQMHSILKTSSHVSSRYINGTERLRHQAIVQFIQYAPGRFNWLKLIEQNPCMFNLYLQELTDIKQMEAVNHG